jgi:hypothetical protein
MELFVLEYEFELNFKMEYFIYSADE